MKKTYEDMAMDIVKMYLQSKQHGDRNHWTLDNDWDLNSIHKMTGVIMEVANALAKNEYNRNKDLFDKSVEDELSRGE